MPPERSDIGTSAGSDSIGISTYKRYTHPNLYTEILQQAKQVKKKTTLTYCNWKTPNSIHNNKFQLYNDKSSEKIC